MYRIVKKSFIESLENENIELSADKRYFLKRVDKLENDLKNEKHKNILLKSKVADLEFKAESLVSDVEKYIPKRDIKTGKFTSKK